MATSTARLSGYSSVLLIAGLAYLGLFPTALEGVLLDKQFQLLRAWSVQPVEPDIVIVGIDEETLQEYREPLALWHEHIGHFLQAMIIAKPSVVGFDIILPEKSYDFVVPGVDKKLLSGLLQARKSIPIFLGQTVSASGQLRQIFPPILSLLGLDHAGLVLLQPDSDQVIRRYRSVIDFQGYPLKTLSARMAESLNAQSAPISTGYINYVKGTRYTYVPLQQVNRWLHSGSHKKLGAVFSGRPVFLGSVLPFVDRHRSPVPLASWEPDSRMVSGVLLHAQALRSLLTQGLLQPIGALIQLLLIVLASSLFWVGGGVRLSSVVLVCFLLILGLFSGLALRSGWIVPVALPTFIAIFACSVRGVVESLAAYLEKRRLSNSFGRYVSPHVLEEILRGTISPDMAGRRQQVCVLFSDIRDFTSRSESQQPEDIITLLNQYFEEMAMAIHAHGGTVDKFIGDGLMVFFGAPNGISNPSQAAFNAAREMLVRLHKLNDSLATKGIEKITIGVGIHFGEVVVGHVGSKKRHEYTVIGDTVNLASRLEGRTKVLGYPVICSASVVDRLDSSNELVDLGFTPIKGRADEPVFGWKPLD